MLFAEMSPGDWLAIAGAVGTGLGTGGGALSMAIRFAFNKYAEIRREERKHEVAIAQRFTESAERIQREAADDNRKALEESRGAFKTLIEIQRNAMESVAAVVGAVVNVETAVTELREEITGARPRKRRRPRDEAGDDSDSQK